MKEIDFKTYKLIKDNNEVSFSTLPKSVLNSTVFQNLLSSNTLEKVKRGDILEGEISNLVDFGAFVEILPGKDGMVHISELDIKRVNKVTDVLKEGDRVDVMVKSVSPDGKVSLSIKSILLKKQKEGHSK